MHRIIHAQISYGPRISYRHRFQEEFFLFGSLTERMKPNGILRSKTVQCFSYTKKCEFRMHYWLKPCNHLAHLISPVFVCAIFVYFIARERARKRERGLTLFIQCNNRVEFQLDFTTNFRRKPFRMHAYALRKSNLLR